MNLQHLSGKVRLLRATCIIRFKFPFFTTQPRRSASVEARKQDLIDLKTTLDEEQARHEKNSWHNKMVINTYKEKMERYLDDKLQESLEKEKRFYDTQNKYYADIEKKVNETLDKYEVLNTILQGQELDNIQDEEFESKVEAALRDSAPPDVFYRHSVVRIKRDPKIVAYLRFVEHVRYKLCKTSLETIDNIIELNDITIVLGKRDGVEDVCVIGPNKEKAKMFEQLIKTNCGRPIRMNFISRKTTNKVFKETVVFLYQDEHNKYWLKTLDMKNGVFSNGILLGSHRTDAVAIDLEDNIYYTFLRTDTFPAEIKMAHPIASTGHDILYKERLNMQINPQHMVLGLNGDIILSDPVLKRVWILSIHHRQEDSNVPVYAISYSYRDVQSPAGICVCVDKILLCDTERNVVISLHPNGELIGTILDEASGLEKPKGVAVYKKDILVVAEEGGSVKYFQVDPKLLNIQPIDQDFNMLAIQLNTIFS